MRYLHLLSPIRDLARNMGIDIALHLNQYLEELDKVTITFDGGQSSMNFAGAAMLIQNSTWIYSKKVDFLYTLTQQLLEMLRSNKKLQQAQQLQNASLEDQANESEEFLSLDDKYYRNEPHTHFEKGDENNGNPPTLFRSPPVLVPLDSDERGDTHIYDLKGELIGNKNDFNLNTYTVHPMGVLLYDTSMMAGEDGCTCRAPHLEEVGIAADGHTSDVDAEFGGAGDLTDHDDHRSMAVDEPDKTSIPPSRKANDDLFKAAERARKILEPLNPHEPVPRLDRLPRKGKTFHIMKLRPRDLTTKLIPINEFCSRHFFSHASKFPKDVPKDILRPCFEALYYREYKRRKALKKDLFSSKVLKDEEEGRPGIKEESDGDSHCSDFPAPGGDDDFLENDGAKDEVLQPHRLSRLENAILAEKSECEQSRTHNMTFEDLLRKHTDEFLLNLKLNIHLTKTVQVVRAWEDKMCTVLEEEDSHKPFDIRAYCTKVLSKFSTSPSKQTITFSRVVNGVPLNDVARLFLATLQLANNYNIEIVVPKVGDHAVYENFELTLLSRRQHFEDLDEFHAA